MVISNSPIYEVSGGLADWLQKQFVHDYALLRHSLSVAELSAAFALYLGFSRSDCQSIHHAALLHDIGKLAIDIDVLRKPGELTPAELAQVRRHPELGFQLLSAQGEKNSVVLSVVREHHERADGSGYPMGLVGTQIGLAVRIVTVCDVFVAMTECRPYCGRYGRAEAMERMSQQHLQLDPRLLKHFHQLMRL